MHNRTAILILLACIFAVISALGANRQAALCADRYSADSDDFLSFSFGNDGSCPVESPSTSPGTPLERLLLVLSAGCAVAACISAGKVWKDRQQDRALLQGAAFAIRRQHYR